MHARAMKKGKVSERSPSARAHVRARQSRSTHPADDGRDSRNAEKCAEHFAIAVV